MNDDDEEKVPTLDCTIGGVPVEFPQEFWREVWKNVVDKIIELDEEDKKKDQPPKPGASSD